MGEGTKILAMHQFLPPARGKDRMEVSNVKQVKCPDEIRIFIKIP
jgi:hypothetical protein